MYIRNEFAFEVLEDKQTDIVGVKKQITHDIIGITGTAGLIGAGVSEAIYRKDIESGIAVGILGSAAMKMFIHNLKEDAKIFIDSKIRESRMQEQRARMN